MTRFELAAILITLTTLVQGTLSFLLFGALISPTDPIAAMAILQKAPIQKEVEIQITGESLLNDAVGVVLFSILLQGLSIGRLVDAIRRRQAARTEAP